MPRLNEKETMPIEAGRDLGRTDGPGRRQERLWPTGGFSRSGTDAKAIDFVKGSGTLSGSASGEFRVLRSVRA